MSRRSRKQDQEIMKLNLDQASPRISEVDRRMYFPIPMELAELSDEDLKKWATRVYVSFVAPVELAKGDSQGESEAN